MGVAASSAAHAHGAHAPGKELFGADADCTGAARVPARIVVEAGSPAVDNSGATTTCRRRCVDERAALALVVRAYERTRQCLEWRAAAAAAAHGMAIADDRRALLVYVQDTAQSWPRAYYVTPHGAQPLPVGAQYTNAAPASAYWPPPPGAWPSRDGHTKPAEAASVAPDVRDVTRWWWHTLCAATVAAATDVARITQTTPVRITAAGATEEEDDDDDDDNRTLTAQWTYRGGDSGDEWPVYTALRALVDNDDAALRAVDDHNRGTETTTRNIVHPPPPRLAWPHHACHAALLACTASGAVGGDDAPCAAAIDWILVLPPRAGHEHYVAQLRTHAAQCPAGFDNATWRDAAARQLVAHLDLDAPWRALDLVPLRADDERCVRWAEQRVRARCPRATDTELHDMALEYLRASAASGHAYVALEYLSTSAASGDADVALDGDSDGCVSVTATRLRAGMPVVPARFGSSLDFAGNVVRAAEVYVGDALSAEALRDHVTLAVAARDGTALKGETHSGDGDDDDDDNEMHARGDTRSGEPTPAPQRHHRRHHHHHHRRRRRGQRALDADGVVVDQSVSASSSVSTPPTPTPTPSPPVRGAHRRYTIRDEADDGNSDSNDNHAPRNTMHDYGVRLARAVDAYMIRAFVAHADLDAAYGEYAAQRPHNGAHLDLYVLRAAARWLTFWGSMGFSFVVHGASREAAT